MAFVKSIAATVGLSDLAFFPVPNDTIEFNCEDYDDVSLTAKGHLDGNVKVRHGRYDVKKTTIVTKLFLADQSVLEHVRITPTFNERSFSMVIEGPESHFKKTRFETEIIFPTELSSLTAFRVDAPAVNVEIDKLENMFVDACDINTKHGNIECKFLKTTSTRLRTTNGNITGSYSPLSRLILNTHSGTIDASSSGSDQPSLIELVSNNGSIKGFYRMPSTFSATTFNGSVTLSGHIMAGESVEATAQSSNGGVSLAITKAYQGGFELETKLGSATVKELLDVKFDVDTRVKKTGTKGTDIKRGNISLKTLNGSVKLEFS